MATSAVEVDAIPSLETGAILSVQVDASPLNADADTIQIVHKLDPILNKLTISDYRSIFFLFIDTILKKEDFLFWVQKESDFLRNKFINIYYEFRFKDAMLIELFGTMQKYDLLKSLGTCRHTYEKDKETFSQLSSLWKFLYSVCEQLTDGEVDYLKEKLFPEDVNIICAEQLICQAFVRGKLMEKDWESKLADIFKSFLPGCSQFITTYKGSKLSYYPLRRPTKTTPCGIAVIVNQVKFDGKFPDRPESVKDANALKKLWESFGFKTEIHTNFTAEEVNQLFDKLSRENHSNYDAFVACYLSHGDEGVVAAIDGKFITLTDLIDKIANACDTLVGKPKLFFVQACQGVEIQTGFGGRIISTGPIQRLTSNTQVPASRLSRNVALRSDVLLFNSTIERFVSFRGNESSWFIDALVSNMEKFGEELTITNILPKIVKEVSDKEGDLNINVTKCKQTPVWFNTLKYELQLKKVL